MIQKKYFSILVFLLVIQSAYGQKNPIKYFDLNKVSNERQFNIIDSETEEPIPYSHVLLKSENFGAVADSKGRVKINLNLRDTLTISSVGYETLTIAAHDLNNIQNIYLQKNDLILNEIIVKGLSVSVVEVMQSIINKIPENYFIQNLSFNSQLISKHIEQNKVKTALSKVKYEKGYVSSDYKFKSFIIDPTSYQIYNDESGKWESKTYNQNAMLNEIRGVFVRDFIATRNDNFLNKKNLKAYDFSMSSADSTDEMIIEFRANKISNKTVPYAYLKSFTGKMTVCSESLAIKEIKAVAIIDQKHLNDNDDTRVPMIEIQSYYDKLDSTNKYVWYKSIYQDYTITNLQIINENHSFEY